MQKAGLYTLLAILGFALVFAFWPGADQAGAQTGATLRGVELRLYPTRDPEAVWSFSAQQVTHDPLNSQTRLSGISDGQRVILERDGLGQLTGQKVLDAKLATGELLIDGRDDITTSQAQITLVKECATIDLRGLPDKPVKIEQGYGFTAEKAVLESPSMSGEISGLRMSFQFDQDGGQFSKDFRIALDPTETCQGGQRVPLQPSP